MPAATKRKKSASSAGPRPKKHSQFTIESNWTFDNMVQTVSLYNEATAAREDPESTLEYHQDIVKRSREVITWGSVTQGHEYDVTATETELEQCIYWLHYIIHEAGLHIEQCYMWRTGPVEEDDDE